LYTPTVGGMRISKFPTVQVLTVEQADRFSKFDRCQIGGRRQRRSSLTAEFGFVERRSIRAGLNDRESQIVAIAGGGNGLGDAVPSSSAESRHDESIAQEFHSIDRQDTSTPP